jgi:hypothetical protein
MFIRPSLKARAANMRYIDGASMALQSHAMTLQSSAALAEIRDTLLETYASNDAMNQLIL